MDIEKRPQNSVFLIENRHLTDGLVYESIFQTKISLLPYVFVRLALKPLLPGCNHSFNSILLAWENFRIPSGPHIDHPTSNCQVRALWTYDENEQKKDISNQESMSFSDTNINKNSEALTNAKKLFGTSD